MKKTILSQCASCENYISQKRPNPRIPFKGDFPIVKVENEIAWHEMFNKHMYLEDCPEWFRETIAKAMKIESISCAFDEYLYNAGIKNFDELKAPDKADWLIRFMNKNCMSNEALYIG